MTPTAGIAPATCAGSKQCGRHGRQDLRGLEYAQRSSTPPGRFGMLFPGHAANFGKTEAEVEANLAPLADKMLGDPKDKPKDGPDNEESGLPALYTYFGQFIDHDITFDPSSSLQKKNDVKALTDYRSPALDLDSVYGRGPEDQPYLYVDSPDGKGALHFLEGVPINGGGDPKARDLPRNLPHPRALIGDPRNDENVIVSQLQGLFLRFHNRMAHDNPKLTFDEVQQKVRFHYQHVVLYDFLPAIVSNNVLLELKKGSKYDREKLKFFHWKKKWSYMPVEFSVAAYRLGHSMVRPGYRLNDNGATLLPIFSDGSQPALGGFGPRDPHWGIDWGRFIDIERRRYDGSPEARKKRLQFAYKIDTTLVNPLKNVSSVVSGLPHSLPFRNLKRGWSLKLASGQTIARRMELEPLADQEIKIGKDKTPITSINPIFAGNCPLWAYILAEASHHSKSIAIPVLENDGAPAGTEIKHLTPQLGPVGGRIVAEVLLGLMFGDKSSLLTLTRPWQPDLGMDFDLKKLIRYATGS